VFARHVEKTLASEEGEDEVACDLTSSWEQRWDSGKLRNRRWIAGRSPLPAGRRRGRDLSTTLQIYGVAVLTLFSNSTQRHTSRPPP
jgi:hypothetical protein